MKDKFGNWLYVVGACVAGLVLFVAIWWLPWIIARHDVGYHVLRKLDGDKRSTAVNSVRTTLLQAIAGLVLLVGAVFTGRQLHVAREGQVTDRYTKATDQLGRAGEDRVDVRIGGIYALERIARDSEADRTTIVEVLAAFVRSHAPLPRQTLDGDHGGPVKPTPRTPRMSERATDVQTALTVLGRLPRPETLAIDLDGAHLSVAHLADANLAYAHLRNANLERATLTGAHLEHARLYRANLHIAFLDQSHMKNGDLVEANLSTALLTRADLTGANLRKANLQGAFLVRTKLTGATLIDADLTDASLIDADLLHADLSGADLTGARYNAADGEHGTKWPDGFDPQKAGAVLRSPEASAGESSGA